MFKNLSQKITINVLYAFIFGISFFSLGSAFYLQYVQNQYPCNLCLAQRFAYYVLLIWSALSLVSDKLGWKKTSLFAHIGATVFALIGLIFALRQLYLQHFASQESLGCGIDLVSMFEMFAPVAALQKLFEGTTDCAARDWLFLGLSIADYSALIFIALLGFMLTLIYKKVKQFKSI